MYVRSCFLCIEPKLSIRQAGYRAAHHIADAQPAIRYTTWVAKFPIITVNLSPKDGEC